MFHGEGCLNNVLHFFIVSLHFSSMNSIISWCLNVMIEWTLELFVAGGKLYDILCQSEDIQERCYVIRTFGTTGTGLSPCLTENTRRIVMTINLP